MSDKVELIAAAQVNVVGGSPGLIEFKSNFGFKAASRGSAGSYELTLDDKHDAHKLVVNVTRNSIVAGDIAAAPVSTGDVNRLQVTTSDSDVAADSPFYITVWRVRS
jgi:hypothetical protein